MRYLILQLDAPLMSFGGVRVDSTNPTEEVPMVSLLTGLIGNALGYDHSEADKLTQLQERIVYGARVDRKGKFLSDFHTVALGQEHLSVKGWTTRGFVEKRGGASSEDTHIRNRHYHADRVVTVALTLSDSDQTPTLEDVRDALLSPERPLFIGRKCCLPSCPLVVRSDVAPEGILLADNLADALVRAPMSYRADSSHHPTWTVSYEDAPGALLWRDKRDWKNQIHGDRRYLHRGRGA